MHEDKPVFVFIQHAALMGQHQLILLVLGIVVVMIAMLSGFTAFTEKQRHWDDETRRHAMLTLAIEAQAWKIRPALTGGGDNGRPADFSTLRLGHLGYEAAAARGERQIYRTPDGLCLRLAPAPTHLRIDALEDDCQTDAGFAVTVSGARAVDLAWSDAN